MTILGGGKQKPPPPPRPLPPPPVITISGDTCTHTLALPLLLCVFVRQSPRLVSPVQFSSLLCAPVIINQLPLFYPGLLAAVAGNAAAALHHLQPLLHMCSPQVAVPRIY